MVSKQDRPNPTHCLFRGQTFGIKVLSYVLKLDRKKLAPTIRSRGRDTYVNAKTGK